MKINFLLSRIVLLIVLTTPLHASIDDAPLLNRSTLGLTYDLAFMPSVSRVTGGDKLSLNQLHRASLEVMYPYFRYLSLGVSFDYTLAMSEKLSNPQLNFSKDSAPLKSTFLGLTGRIRPQLPFEFSQMDLILYTEAQLGFGTSSPIAFGTEPLSDYEYNNTNNIPTPFPMMFETTPKIGLQLFAWRFIGVDVGVGYRMMWVVHPLVSIPKKSIKDDMTKDTRGAIIYDVSSLFLQMGLRLAF